MMKCSQRDIFSKIESRFYIQLWSLILSEVLIQSLESWALDESYDFKKVAQQASGSVWYRCGGTILLASVTIDEENEVNEDFLPLTIQYIEKAYANAKFPSGFIKREGKPSDFETLTSRIIDRTLRPLFPQNYRHPTQISVFVLSYDGLSDLQVCSLHAASSALYISNIPLCFPVNAVRIGKNQDGFLIHPNMQEMQTSCLDLYVSGCNEDILMIEMKSLRQNDCMNEISEEELFEAIELAKNIIANQSELFEKHFKKHIRSPISISSAKNAYSEMISLIQTNFTSQLTNALTQMAKSERASDLNKLAKDIAHQMQWDFQETINALDICKKELVRQMILEEKKRVDGRKLNEVREIQIQTNLLPNAHGSCLFKRGQTQALVVSTIGGENDAQSYELLGDKTSSKERFMVHYNFPSFCVGETSIIGVPGRRELGHGNLVKRALESSINDRRVVRLVSEILESNGSSSMASVCGGSLALKASGVQTEKLVAGVAMGLIKEKEKYAILSDIMGLEDHCGDMDFKIAGTKEGITALQMDIKLGGIDTKILQEAIKQAREARLHILSIMQEAQEKICINNLITPMILSFQVPTERIVEIIGQGGKTIKEIIELFNVSIDLNRSNGEIKVTGIGKDRLEQTKAYILDLLQKNKPKNFLSYEVGTEFQGKIKKIVDFGAFIEMPNGGDGLLHISKIRTKGAKLAEGNQITCKILSIAENKIELDIV